MSRPATDPATATAATASAPPIDPDAPPPAPPRGLRYVFRTLRHRNYRLFFCGQSLSLIGTWMSLIAMGWLIHRLTGDPLMLGLLGFFMHVPTFLLSPVAGALVDRMPRRRVLLTTQSIDMLAMFSLAALTLAGLVAPWHVFLVASTLGLTKAFDIPGRQALVAEVVADRNELSNAIALNSSMFHGARLVGPVVAGAIIYLVPERGEGVCFLVGAVSYLFVIWALLMLRLVDEPAQKNRRPLLRDVQDGFAYAFGFAPCRAMLMPVFASDVLGGTSATFGILVAASGAGALVGSLYLAARPTVLGLGRVIAGCVVVYGLALIAFSQSTLVPLSMAILVVVAGCSMVAFAGSNTIIQTLVDDARRGRVMSFFAMSFMGAMPLGNLIAGSVASRYGAPTTVAAGGLLCMVAGVLFAWHLPTLRAIARPIYAERGIIPPINEAARSA